ncbi:hypothetical protein C0Q70_06235 [Pomacea canaliculata]|uniref:Uncharacterized protein n=1 Tax=Pomacea canaliculata TaxID=400727 RepID=A0A2T7PNE8_POMCA|nr:hypothetical protein C0Q70_06235 [Pomacea canaliculata]
MVAGCRRGKEGGLQTEKTTDEGERMSPLPCCRGRTSTHLWTTKGNGPPAVANCKPCDVSQGLSWEHRQKKAHSHDVRSSSHRTPSAHLSGSEAEDIKTIELEAVYLRVTCNCDIDSRAWLDDECRQLTNLVMMVVVAGMKEGG